MARIIVKCRYLSNASAHLENYISYMATRDGVEKMAPNLPSTIPQQKLIDRLVKSFPTTKDMFEYEDYLASSTAANASEFITQAIEQNADLIGKRENYIDYIANRPRVERLSSHGLFSDTGQLMNLSQVQNEVANHTGNVWTNVFSLRREDAARLGFDNAAAWSALLREKRNHIAQSMRISPENFRWYGAFHDEGHHPHVHFVCYSENPTEAYLSSKGIDAIRSCLATEIFKQDRLQIYTEQTKWRDELGNAAKDTLRKQIDAIKTRVCTNPAVAENLVLLSKRLANTGGKKVYGYLKPDVKAIVDIIVDELSKDEYVADCYSRWQNLRNEIIATYSDKPQKSLSLSAQKEFKSVKNMVIKEALKLGVFSFDDGAQLDLAPEQDGMTTAEEMQFDVPEPELPYSETDGAKPEGHDDILFHADWTDKYKEACGYLYGTRNLEPDFATAYRIFLSEADAGNVLAMSDIGRMYAAGLGREIDNEIAQNWYSKAFKGFLFLESEQNVKTRKTLYFQYRIGKMYAAGLGTEQDYMQAAKWFTKASALGHKYAQYSLAGLYHRGQGVDQDFAEAFRLYGLSARQENAYASYELAKMYRDGVGIAQDDMQSQFYFTNAFDKFVDMENERADDKLQYRIGQMLRDGVGTEKNEEDALQYFERSAALGNTYAEYALAKQYLLTGDAEKIMLALGHLEKSADAGNATAQYALGKLYRDGLSGEHNDYLEKDVSRAVAFFTDAALQENDYAAYALGKLYLSGEYVPKDVPAAIAWLTKSADQENQFAQYALGKLYIMGKDVPRDKELAKDWLTLSAAQGNIYAQFFLDHFDEFRDPSLFMAATNLLRQIGKIFEQEAQTLHVAAAQIDRKQLRKLREKKMALGHAKDDHEPKQNIY